ncbi:MAG: SPFH domain-containing protein [Methanoregula sp.]|uniref:SPFH domain-containing protein n=1 Tax=Methanoregula sp. TaxID=2052170 RepID=UPI0025DFEFD0|nr:SPFH domain-containing protein [Methanoregula sp.]MCK9630007.1 SPFH domain-containing protein [Methanoregula sp.]
MVSFIETLIVIFLVLVIIAIFAKGVVIIQPYEQGLLIRLGQYIGRMNPGFRWIVPFISEVTKLDLRTQVMDVPSQEVITKDNSPTNVDAIVYIRVIDPEKAYFEVANYRIATIALAQTSLRGIIGDMELDEVLYNRDVINTKLRDILDRETDQWGVKVERVEIKEVDPVEAVKSAMTEQTAAERARRAAILRADGEKRSAILKAEGLRQSMILEAEGERQSKVLRAEGERLSRILQAQGEAQGLRILSVGAAPLDRKAITVLSLDALKSMSNGQATKIIFPFEISELIRQGAKFLGAKDESVEEVAGRPVMDDSILGVIPKQDTIDAILKDIQDAVPKVSEDELKDTSKRKVLPLEKGPEE